MNKICKGCKKEKDISDFYKHPKTSDGYLNYCKECIRIREKEYRLKNPEVIRLREKKRWQKRKLDPLKRERRQEYQKKWRTYKKNKAHRTVERNLKYKKPDF